MTSRACAHSMLQMAARAVVLLIGVSLVVPVADSIAAEPYECIELSVSGEEGAKFTNICNEMMNLMYCVNVPQSPKTCSAERLGITTLVPLASEVVPDYTATGGEIFVAICAYPTAPVGWKPGRDSPFECKKTCVMC